MTPKQNELLSAEGTARRERMLDDILSYADRLRDRRQKRIRVVTSLGTVGVLAVIATVLLQPGGQAERGPRVVMNDHDGSKYHDGRSSKGVFETVHTDPAVLVRFTPPPIAKVVRISDKELEKEFGELGLPIRLETDGDHYRLSHPLPSDEIGLPARTPG